MATINKTVLRGIIEEVNKKFKKKTEDENNPPLVEIRVTIKCVRRPYVLTGKNELNARTDYILVKIRDKDQLEYVVKCDPQPGDEMDVIGLYCTMRGKKQFDCGGCGKRNYYEGVVTYVAPAEVRVIRRRERCFEEVELSKMERFNREQLDDGHGHTIPRFVYTARSRLKHSGSEWKVLTEDYSQGENGRFETINGIRQPMYTIKFELIKARDTASEKPFLLSIGEMSNWVLIIGQLVNDPVLYTEGKDGKEIRMCTFQLGLDRKMHILADGPYVYADYPYIRTFGEEAEHHSVALRRGSLVAVEGAVQQRSHIPVRRVCQFCGREMELNDRTQDIVAYSVEYLNDYQKTARDMTSDKEMLRNLRKEHNDYSEFYGGVETLKGTLVEEPEEDEDGSAGSWGDAESEES